MDRSRVYCLACSAYFSSISCRSRGCSIHQSMCAASCSECPTSYSDSGQSANWLAALCGDFAMTGTSPHAMPSITLTDSRSAIDGWHSRSHDCSNAGMSLLRWKPMDAGRASFLRASRSSLRLIGPVPAIVRWMSSVCALRAIASMSSTWFFSFDRRPDATILNGTPAASSSGRCRLGVNRAW